MNPYKPNQKFGILIGTRGFFNGQLAQGDREKITTLMKRLGFSQILLPAAETPSGAVESVDDAKKCAALFGQHRESLDGVVVLLPNFGDEVAIANTLRLANLNVPVLIQATNDRIDRLDIKSRRDSFCGKISVCNNLIQYGIPFSLTSSHTCDVDSPGFENDLLRFAAVCRVVKGLRNARLGAVGARPGAFQTMRYSEKILQANGISVISVDLSEILAAANKIGSNDGALKEKLAEIHAYGSIEPKTASEAIQKQARFGLALDRWIAENDIQAAGVLCWQSIQFNLGCAACLSMSLLGEKGIPCACEVDIMGAISMYALGLASQNASALIDWNNNYGDDPDLCVVQHCSNHPKSFFKAPISIGPLGVMSANIGEEICFGAVKGKIAAGPMTYLRATTDDLSGRIKAYCGDAAFTSDPADLDGGTGVCRIPRLQELMQYMCLNAFEHHGAMVRGHCAGILREAFERYLGWNTYVHG